MTEAVPSVHMTTLRAAIAWAWSFGGRARARNVGRFYWRAAEASVFVNRIGSRCALAE